MTLDGLKKLCDAATPGPWTAYHARDDIIILGEHDDVAKLAFNHGEDAAFIAMAREMLPKLIKVAEASQAWIDDVRVRGHLEASFSSMDACVETLAALETP